MKFTRAICGLETCSRALESLALREDGVVRKKFEPAMDSPENLYCFGGSEVTGTQARLMEGPGVIYGTMEPASLLLGYRWFLILG